MTTMTMASPESSLLGMASPKLPLLVSKATVEFDRAAQGHCIGFNSARLLSEYLKSALGHAPSEGAAMTSFDAATVGIIGRALDVTPRRDTTIADVVSRAWTIAEQMESTSPDSDKKSFERCKRFCIEFGNNLIQYKESYSPLVPENPFKR